MSVTIFTVSVAFLLLAGATIWRAFRFEPHHPKVHVHTISVPQWRTGTELRLLQLSDLHLWRLTAFHRRVVAAAAALDPDLIVVTGDYAESAEGLSALADLIAELKRLAPVYAVLGDNDQDNPEWERKLEAVFARSEVPVLRNSARLLSVDDEAMLLIGTDDPNTGRSRVEAAEGEALRLVRTRGVADDLDAVYTVVLAHSPEIVTEARPWMDLILTGHTHGGQLCLPGGIALYTNTPACRGFSSGMYRLTGDGRLYVPRGIGTARNPARLFCPPEVTQFLLQGAAGQTEEA